ncbi:MAG: hypothetical protein ACR2IE_10020 [Candidatus Sumerlaeaceae bacterium]
MIRFFRAEFEAEHVSGFPVLSRVPDTHIRISLKQFGKLDQATQYLLQSAVALKVSDYFSPEWGNTKLPESELAVWESFFQSTRGVSVLDELPLKLLKNAAGWQRSEHEHIRKQVMFPMSDELLARLDHVTTAKAADLRKLIKQVFEERFGLVPKKLGGGDWEYRTSEGEASPVVVKIDFGGTWCQQLRYEIDLHRPGWQLYRLNYERLFGFGSGDWDYITEETAPQAINLLAELVEYVRRLPERMEAFMCSAEDVNAQ